MTSNAPHLTHTTLSLMASLKGMSTLGKALPASLKP